MFAKLLAELKRIAILLQSKKLVDKDYVPDEGGEGQTDDKFYLLASRDGMMQIITGPSFHKSDLTKIDFTTINNDCLANELFTTKGIDVVNKIIKNLPSDFITGGHQRNYYFPTVESIDYNLISLPNLDTKPDFNLTGFNNQTEMENIRGIIIKIPITTNGKRISAVLSEGSYLTENTQFTYINKSQQ